MPSAKTILFVLLGLFAVYVCAVWAWEMTRRREWAAPTLYQTVVGVITDFLDTLGIGSYATTTTLYRLKRTIADENLPGTLTVGHALPTITQAFIYIAVIQVEMKTLVLLILASVLGAWLGALVVTRLPRRGILVGMGGALLVASVFLTTKLVYGNPDHEEGTLGLDGPLLAVALAGNFLFGALMTIGVGAYAPILIMVSLLGMNVKAAFPIMMGSCAFLMPVAGARFIRAGRYDPRAALGLTLGGIPAVLVAAFIVKELPLQYLGWLVLVVVLYAAGTLLWAASQPTVEPPVVSADAAAPWGAARYGATAITADPGKTDIVAGAEREGVQESKAQGHS